MEKRSSRAEGNAQESLVDIVFSWTLNDVLNDGLYKHKVLHAYQAKDPSICIENSFVSHIVHCIYLLLLLNNEYAANTYIFSFLISVQTFLPGE